MHERGGEARRGSDARVRCEGLNGMGWFLPNRHGMESEALGMCRRTFRRLLQKQQEPRIVSNPCLFWPANWPLLQRRESIVTPMATVPVRVELPRVMFGTSTLGNLYAEVSHEEKLGVVKKVVETLPAGAIMFDSAGKYGAGLALEELGKCLKECGVRPQDVLISNKLAWKRAPLSAPGAEPTFEPGVWKGLKHDAVQDISYQGMLDCYKDGNALLGDYSATEVSVHDPDEYLDAAKDAADLDVRRENVLGAYRALRELKEAGKVRSIGVGAKNCTAIEWISDALEAQGWQLDWAMFACSVTVKSHSEVAQRLLQKLAKRGVAVINSAVFNGGFLIGGKYFDYREPTIEAEPELFAWREAFHRVCAEFDVKATAACVQFSFLFPQVKSVALATSRAGRVVSNVKLATDEIPRAFWDRLKSEGLTTVLEDVVG